MRILGFSRGALMSCAAAAMLAGCGGSQPPISAPGAMPKTSAIATHAERGKSWMLPEAKSEDLLYVTDVYAGLVHVFSYPTGHEVGALEVGGNPRGECVDKIGDIWITRFRTTSVVEYAHGGTTSLGSVSTYPNSPWGCSVDPTTGNLAVTNTEGSIGVYANAQGDPTLYTVQGDDYGFTFCTYDDSGNLFATAPYSNIAELPTGSSKMMNLQLNFSINPWSVQWDERGKYLAVAGIKLKGDPTSIYHVSVSGGVGKLVGTTLLKRSKSVYPSQYWIQGAKLLGTSSILWHEGQIEKRVDSWPYPDGGNPTRFARVARLPSGQPDLYGVVVSKAIR